MAFWGCKVEGGNHNRRGSLVRLKSHNPKAHTNFFTAVPGAAVSHSHTICLSLYLKFCVFLFRCCRAHAVLRDCPPDHQDLLLAQARTLHPGQVLPLLEIYADAQVQLLEAQEAQPHLVVDEDGITYTHLVCPDGHSFLQAQQERMKLLGVSPKGPLPSKDTSAGAGGGGEGSRGLAEAAAAGGGSLTGSGHNIWALLRARNIPSARDGYDRGGGGLLRWQQRQLELRAQLQEAAESVDWPWKPRDLELLQQRFHLLEGTGPGRAMASEDGEEGSVLTYEGFLKFWKHLRRLLPEVGAFVVVNV